MKILDFGGLRLHKQSVSFQLSFKLFSHSYYHFFLFWETKLVSTPLHAQTVITTQHVSSWVKNYSFSFLLQRKHHPELWSQYSEGDMWSFFTPLGCERYCLPCCAHCKPSFCNKDGVWLQHASEGALILVAGARCVRLSSAANLLCSLHHLAFLLWDPLSSSKKWGIRWVDYPDSFPQSQFSEHLHLAMWVYDLKTSALSRLNIFWNFLNKSLILDPFWIWTVTSGPCYRLWNLSVSPRSPQRRTRGGSGG